ncbi:antibiotic biosynthesis monooxygenase [Streptomyces griseus]|uniref:antibiotic biosynthesis monooxygenase n=1 Tax=Streptomyces griseus TaxID=1911 RepID=UPI0036BF793A
MSVAAATRPVIDRPDVDSVLVGVFRTGEGGRGRAVAQGVADFWSGIAWPAGLLSVTCYISTDGMDVLTYEQWADHDAAISSLGQGGLSRTAPVEGMVDVVAVGPVHYHLYRSSTSDEPRVPGCFVFASLLVDGHEAARQWVDQVLDSVDMSTVAERDHPGGISAHFHISVDGTSALNYAEWDSEDAHIGFIEGSVRKEALSQVGGMPRTAGVGDNRFLLFQGLVDS